MCDVLQHEVRHRCSCLMRTCPKHCYSQRFVPLFIQYVLTILEQTCRPPRSIALNPENLDSVQLLGETSNICVLQIGFARRRVHVHTRQAFPEITIYACASKPCAVPLSAESSAPAIDEFHRSRCNLHTFQKTKIAYCNPDLSTHTTDALQTWPQQGTSVESLKFNLVYHICPTANHA